MTTNDILDIMPTCFRGGLMTDKGFDYSTLFSRDLPTPAGKWQGHPRYNFIGGHHDPELQPMEQFIQAATNVFKGDPRNISMYNSDGPQGIFRLRHFLAEKLGKYRGVHVTPDEILITSGSGQAIELINHVLLEPGDTVIVESLSFAGALSYLRRRRVNIVGIELDNNGMRMDRLEETLRDLTTKGVQPKYIYTIPTLQNPTGTVMTMERRREMLRLSIEYGVPIFEDECYADLIFEGEYENAIRSLDDSSHVLHIGSFSKSLGPGIRLGYVVSSWQVMSRLLSCKSDAGTGVMDQLIVGEYFSNHYEKHIRNVRSGLKRKCEALTAALLEHFGPSIEVSSPRGGMYLWVKLPPGIDGRNFVEAGLRRDVAFNPGPDWSVDPDAAANYIRLCFALPSEAEIWEGVARLAEVFRV